MFAKRQDKAWWLESIRPLKVEDIDQSLFADGLVEFGYISLKKEDKKVTRGGLETTEKIRILETRADLEFKQGDKIRIGDATTWQDNWFKIVSVDLILEKDKESVVAMFPHLRVKYEIKRIVLI